MTPSTTLLAIALGALLQAQPPATSPPNQVTAESKIVDRLAALPTNAERQKAIADGAIEVTPALLRAINARGAAVLEGHDFAGADAWHQLALGYAEQRQDARLMAQTLRNLSEVARQYNDYEKALDYQQRSLEWARTANDDYTLASGLANMGSVLRRLGLEDEALAYARDGLVVAEKVGLPQLTSAAHTALANALHSLGDLRGALEHHSQSVQINRASGSVGNEAIAICNSGSVYLAQREWPLAIDMFKRCIPMAESIGFKITQARFLDSLATAYLGSGDRALARREAEKSLEIARSINHREVIASAYSTLGEIAWTEGRKADAIATLTESVRTLDEIKNVDILVQALPQLGGYQIGAGQVDAGMATLERGRSIARSIGDRLSLFGASTEAGKALRARGKTAEARAAFDEAIRAVESVRGDVAGSVAQAHFFSDKFDPYHEMVALEAAGGNVDEAFRFAERGRTQALVDVLRGGRVSPSKVMTAEERAEESQLRQRLASANLAAAAATEKSSAARLAARLEQARSAYAEFERTLYARHPELRGARLDLPPAAPGDAAAALPDAGAALLEFVVTDDATYLFVVKKNGTPSVVKLPVTSARLTTLVGQLEQKIASRALDYRTLARELDRILIAPVRSAIDKSTTLVIVPDGPLWRLPFAVLESPAGTPLVDSHALFEIPSVTVLREVQARRRTRPLKTILAVGNPPGAGLDTVNAGFDALAGLYGGANVRVLTGGAASEAAFKANAGRYDIVHVATHGVLDDRNPLYSYVSLAKGPGEDGFLEAREMAELDLHADLVVLSACETARGGFSGGEGLMGMTWALFQAGSPATVASGWKVDEAATSKLMLAFHQHLRKGEARAAALRNATLEVRSEPQYRHPFYWAAFVLSGDGF